MISLGVKLPPLAAATAAPTPAPATSATMRCRDSHSGEARERHLSRNVMLFLKATANFYARSLKTECTRGKNGKSSVHGVKKNVLGDPTFSEKNAYYGTILERNPSFQLKKYV